jgi:hypothetical protein
MRISSLANSTGRRTPLSPFYSTFAAGAHSPRRFSAAFHSTLENGVQSPSRFSASGASSHSSLGMLNSGTCAALSSDVMSAARVSAQPHSPPVPPPHNGAATIQANDAKGHSVRGARAQRRPFLLAILHHHDDSAKRSFGHVWNFVRSLAVVTIIAMLMLDFDLDVLATRGHVLCVASEYLFCIKLFE